jgi:hypothetical protein
MGRRRLNVPDRYIIDVCMTCGRQAVFPFSCGHRSPTERWTVPIVVKPTQAARTVLDAIAEQETSP